MVGGGFPGCDGRAGRSGLPVRGPIRGGGNLFSVVISGVFRCVELTGKTGMSIR
jgi:hypothetical protein